MTMTSIPEADQHSAPAPRAPDVVPPVASGSLTSLIRQFGGPWAWWIFVAALGFVVIAPVALFYARAFEDGAAPIRALPDVPNIGQILGNTVLLALGSTVIAGVLSVSLALIVMKVPLRWRGLAAFLPQLPLIVPPVAMIIGWVFLFAPGIGYGNTFLRKLPFFDHLTEGPVNVYSMTAIVLITGIDLTGIVFAMVLARMHEIGGALNAAARLSGATAPKAFFTVTLPLLRPSLVAGLVVAFLLGLGQFTAPLLLGRGHGIEVLTTKIFEMREQYPVDYAAIAALGLPLLVIGFVSIFIQRAVIGDQRRYVTQSGGGGVSRTSKWALWSVLGYGAVVVLLPLAALTLVAFSSFWVGELSAIEFTTRHFSATLAMSEVTEAITNSVLVSVLAAAVVLPIGFIAALGMSGVLKAPKAVKAVLDFIFIAPLAVPRAMLGMAVLYVFLQPPFNLYGTFALFVIGYAFIVLPFSLRSQYSSLMGVHGSLFEASRVAGAGQLRTIWTIALPLTKRGMTASLAIMVILLSHDFAVSVMLRSPGNQVMGTLIYQFWENGVFPQVAVMALIMTAVTGVLLAATLAIGGRKALENL